LGSFDLLKVKRWGKLIPKGSATRIF